MPSKNSDSANGSGKANEKGLLDGRRHPRIALPKGMWVAWYGGDVHQVSRVGTLGMGGIFICEASPPPIGTKLKVAFEVPGGEVMAEGIVRNIEPGKGMGLQFTKLGPKDRVLLQRLLTRLLR
jgi:hypothetical protein